EDDAAGLDVGDPPRGGALAGAHPGLGRLLGERPVREDVDPHLAATLDVAGHRDTRGLELPVGEVSVLQRLDPEVTEGDLGAALGDARAARVVLLAELGPPGDEHLASLPFLTRWEQPARRRAHPPPAAARPGAGPGPRPADRADGRPGRGRAERRRPARGRTRARSGLPCRSTP